MSKTKNFFHLFSHLYDIVPAFSTSLVEAHGFFFDPHPPPAIARCATARQALQ
jgi:hypothetical protein